MSREYTALDGKNFNDDDIDRWCEAYDKGNFPEGYRIVGPVVRGRPPLSVEGSEVLSVKVPAGMKRAIENAAQAEGVSTSAFAREALSDKLLAEFD